MENDQIWLGKNVEEWMKRKWIIAGVAVIMVLAIGLVIWKRREIKIISPLGEFFEGTPKKNRMVTVGFLPTWMVGKTKIYGRELDQLIFSAVEVGEDGTLVWDVQSKKLDGEAYLKQKENIRANGGKNILGIKLFKDDEIDSLLASEIKKKRLMEEVALVVGVGKFDGVNVDFEYMSNPVRMLSDDFVQFLDEIRQYDWGEVSVDVFANTVIKGDSEKLKRVLESMERMIVMAYDFHRPGSDYAGPVAPIGAETGKKSLSAITAKIIESGIEKEKIVMAYPLYGYEWETDDNSFGSATRTAGYGATVFYKDGIGITGANWDEVSETAWAAWQEKAQRSRRVRKLVGKVYKYVTEYFTVDQWHQAYFENERSLAIKVDLAVETGVGGVGFWALGYEGTEDSIIKNLQMRIKN